MQSVNEISIDSLKSLVDMADKAINPSQKGKGEYTYGSISNYTKNLIMTFPCMCDDSLSATTASMISRANERNIVTMLQILFSSINMSTTTNALDIIKGIHNNIKTNYSIDDYIDTMNDIVGETVNLDSVKERAIIAEMMKSIREAKSFPINSLIEDSSLLNYKVYGNNKNISIREEKNPYENEEYKKPLRNHYAYSDKTITTNPDGSTKETITYNYKNYNKFNPISGKYTNDNKGGYTPDDLDYEKKIVDVKNAKNQEIRAQKKAADDEKDRMDKGQKDLSDFFTKRLLDADVKKANEMQPALMIINYTQLNPKDPTDIIGKSSFVAGVKSRLIPVESQDIIERIFAKNKTKVNFKNFIRATTGEISFVKDFLLCINQAKIDAKNASKKGVAASMWKTLENRSIKNNWNRLRREGNDASAITILVISQETVNALNKYYHIDISKVKAAKDIMDTYNLMGIVIADDSLEVAKFLYAGNDMWDQQAYSFLEKESKDTSYKKMVNLLNKNLV